MRKVERVVPFTTAIKAGIETHDSAISMSGDALNVGPKAACFSYRLGGQSLAAAARYMTR